MKTFTVENKLDIKGNPCAYFVHCTDTEMEKRLGRIICFTPDGTTSENYKLAELICNLLNKHYKNNDLPYIGINY